MAAEPTGTDTLDPQELLKVLTALKDGDFTRLMPSGQSGMAGEIADTINTLLRRLNPFASEVTRIVREVGSQGVFGGQAEVEGLSGTWNDLIANLNIMAANLTHQVCDIARIAKNLADGHPSGKVTVLAQGETEELKKSINRLVDQFSAP